MISFAEGIGDHEMPHPLIRKHLLRATKCLTIAINMAIILQNE
jgi:hypothetical protein